MDTLDTSRTRAIPKKSRRSPLTGSAAVLVGASALQNSPVLPQRSEPHPTAPKADAELLAIAAEFHRLDAKLCTLEAGDTIPDAVFGVLRDEWWSVVDRITSTPADTAEGRAAKASLMVSVLRITADRSRHSPTEQLALSLFRDMGWRTEA